MDYIFLDRSRKKYLPANIIFFIITTVAISLMSANFDNLEGRGQLWNWALVITMLFSSFCGSLIASLMELVLFINTAFFSWEMSQTYGLFVILTCSIVASIPVRFGWYRSRMKSLLAVLFFSISIAASFAMVKLAYNPVRGDDLSIDIDINFFPYAFVVVLICYVFFNYAPAKLKGLFYGAHYYSDNRVLYESESKKRHMGIQHKVTLIIIVEATVLCLAAMFFSFILFDKNANRLTEGSPLSQMFIKGSLVQSNFSMLLSLLNFSVPIMLFANNFAIANIADPIRLMSMGMESFTKYTVYDRNTNAIDINRLGIKTGDEIEDLYKALKSMTAQLTDYIASIQREQELQEEVRIEKEANKAKTSFLSSMSHEIRTPINSVLGLDEMILRESNEEQIVKYAADIKSAGRSLLSLINDILDFSKIESGKLELINAEYDIGSTINDLVNMINSRAEEKGLKFTVSVMPSTPRILYGDEIRIKQCILNILTNAVKYTREGSVTMEIGWEEASPFDIENSPFVLAKEDGKYIMLFARVIDTGIGIKEEDIPKLFQAFQRIEEKRNRTIEGTGLGMNIVQQLLAMMGTKLDVKSVYGKGSTFSFKAVQKVISEEGVGDFSEIYRKSVEEATSYKASFTAPDAKILCVDDTVMNLTVFKGLLKQTKVQIDTAASGEEALRLCLQNHYDILFIDHMMPKLDGIETLHALETLDGNKCAGVPAVALTANAISGARDMYIKEGFTDYLTKPVNSVKLEKMIQYYLPADKVLHEAGGSDACAVLSDPVLDKLSKIDGLDIRKSIEACGGADTCRLVLQQYAESGPDNLDIIKRSFEKGEWKDYTIKVHALKSSSRLAGAELLAKDAAQLEKCGNVVQANEPNSDIYNSAMGEIQHKTPALLEDYKKMLLELQEIFS